jgi:hypothetical protein
VDSFHIKYLVTGRILIEDSDQNLKYLGLLAMSKILKTSPKSVASHKVPTYIYSTTKLVIRDRVQC